MKNVIAIVLGTVLSLGGFQSTFAQGSGMGAAQHLHTLGCTAEGDVAKIVGGR